MFSRTVLAIAGAFLLFGLAGCGDDDDNGGENETGSPSPSSEVAQLEVVSSAFSDGGEIPVKYSCDGDDAPFPLEWTGATGDTETYVLIFDDPDAPGSEPFLHWLMYDIPANMSGFESVSRDGRLPNGAAQGENSRGEIGYAGPCPPDGQTHTYVVTMHALDTALALDPGASREDVEVALEGHVLATGELTGTFGR